MSDPIKHECGIALIRLLKPLDYYRQKYGTALYGLNKLYLLMEKQHNRGQDGAGVVTIKMNMPAGKKYVNRRRSASSQPIKEIFDHIFYKYNQVMAQKPELMENIEWLKQNLPYSGELLLGHLRYGTYGGQGISKCHPFIRQNNWITRNLIMAGNFNMTNTDELFRQLVELGQHPKEKSDAVTVLEKIGHFLDTEVQSLYDKFKQERKSRRESTELIAEQIDIQKILRKSVRDFDGGYALAGLLGHGDAFVLRDPNGIRPAFYYADDEVVVAASERPAIQTGFKLPLEAIEEIKPGHALVIKKNGTISQVQTAEPRERRSCSFERIYFSRGSDADIYQERKKLGYLLTERVLKSIDYDIKNTVFSYIPNTAETAFYGLIEGVKEFHAKQKLERIKEANEEQWHEIITERLRIDKIAIKDVKLRTFITADSSRNEMVQHVYDVTYGVIRKGIDNLVIIDDSIVRGTTLKQSIIRILARLQPKKIIVVSSAPQIRYPDCYGIDMSQLNKFIAFRATIELLKEQGKSDLFQTIYQECLEEVKKPTAENKNKMKSLYDQLSAEDISKKIAHLVTADDIDIPVEVIYQSLENLHAACPNHNGDWYFSGNFPTPGGNRVANRSFINFMEGRNERAY